MLGYVLIFWLLILGLFVNKILFIEKSEKLFFVNKVIFGFGKSVDVIW